uniref:MFS domain-containing protein n=1 Tax=Syphacia muris TaxID=451379 RepID=A0A0N5AGE1_9BILA
MHFTDEKSLLTSVVAGAALIANFIVVSLVNQFGIRYIFTALGILTAVATCLIPLSIRLGFYYVLATRFVQGIAFAANFPVIGGFCSRWAYYKQNGLFVSVLVAYVQLSPALTMPVSGLLCGRTGWPSVFYVHGTFCLVLFFIYGLLYRNNPQKHPMVGDKEINKIRIGKVEASGFRSCSASGCSKKDLKKIPYLAILKTPSVWAIWLAAVGNFTCINLLFLFSPIYINKVLRFEVSKTGLNAALAPVTQFIVKMVSGIASDKITFLSETDKLRLFNSIAFFGSATFLFILSAMNTSYMTLCMIIMGSGTGLLGATTGGFFKAAPLISKQYSHFVTGNISLGITITMLFVPIIMSTLAPDNTPEEWSLVFVVIAVGLILSNIIFCSFVKGEACEWTTQEYVLRHSTHRIHGVDTAIQTVANVTDKNVR